MRKHIILAVVATMALSTFAGCAGKTETETTNTASSSKEFDYSNALDITKLGQYAGVEIETDAKTEITDESVESYIKSVVEYAGYVKDTEADVVKEDSIVNVDYVGSIDGVPFDGGTAKNVNIDVAANGDVNGSSYIAGFTAGLPGAKVGEEKAYEVTFPENYGKEQLNGKTVIFTFKINHICKTVKYEELDDALAKELFGMNSVAELKTYVRSMLENSAETSRKDKIMDEVKKKVVEESEVELPEDIVTARVDLYCNQIEAQAESMGTDIDSFCMMYVGVTFEEYVMTLKSTVRDYLKEEYVFNAIAQKEGLSFDQAEYDQYVAGLLSAYSAYGINTKEDLYATMKPSENENGETYVKNMFICEKALNFCVDKAVVKDAESKAN